MDCPRCQHDNRPGAKFCEECAGPLTRTCARCGTALSPAAKFCPECAHGASPPATPEARFGSPESYTPKHLAEKILTSRIALEGERKQVTVLFCDLANSTALAERLGPETMHALLNGFFELALAETHRYEGTINQFLGDGCMALFGAPLAHEDHARRAVLAALGIRRRLGEALGAPGLADVELAVRMGLNTGFVVVGSIGDNLRMDYTAVGDTTHLAARLQQRAEPGTILLSDATARLVKGYVRLQALGEVAVKGKTGPLKIHRVVGVGPRRSPLEGLDDRALSRFVGRERELEELLDLLAQAEDQQGQVVGIVGEPGVGKSRLLFELRRALGGRRVTYLEGRCLSFGGAIPYLPVIDIVRSVCGITDADSPDVIVDKVGFALQELGKEPAEWAPYLLQLLGVREGTEGLDTLGPEAVKGRTFELLRDHTLRGSERRPIIMVVEDLHWIDRTSEEWLESLVESLAGAAVLLLTTYRSGYRPPWVEKSYATQISLRRLGRDASLAVLHSTLGEPERLPEHVAGLILDKAEGNPFFLEEMARAVLEHGTLGSDVTVPETIHGVLMARIDRLPEDTKRVLQTASVLGREFSLSLLGAIWDGAGIVGQRLVELKRLEFLYERAGTGEPVYVFKHALTQDVAYSSLLVSRRRALHAGAGRALETLYAGRLEEAYDRLAHHYAKTDEAAKAVEYLTALADKAARTFANTEAVAALEDALVHVERLPTDENDRRRLEIVLRLVHSFYFLGRLQDTVDLLLSHRDRVEHLRDSGLSGRYYFWLAHTWSYLGNQDQAGEAARRALAEGERSGDEATMGKAYYVLARRGFWSCRFPEGVDHGRRAIELLERTEEWLWLGQAHWAVGVNHHFMGEFDRALEAMTRAYAIGDATGNPRLLTYTEWARGWTLATRGDWQAGLEACQRSLEGSRDAVNTACALGWSGFAHLEKGDPAAAIPLLEQAIEGFARIGYESILGWFKSWLADALRLGGKHSRVRQVATEALEIGTKFANPYSIGLVRRVLGRIALSDGELPAAEACLADALETFTAIQSRFEVAVTRLDLAALVMARGDPAGASGQLAEAHATFTALAAPKLAERAERLAGELGVPLHGGRA